MPEYWYSLRGNDDELNARIAATKKPYFMIYRYPKLGKERNKLFDYLVVNAPKKCKCEYFQLAQSDHPDAAMLLEDYQTKSPVTDYDCVVNQISHYIEDEIMDFKSNVPRGEMYNYSLLKSNVQYSKIQYNKVKKIFEKYQKMTSSFVKQANYEQIDNDECIDKKEMFLEDIKAECGEECPDENKLAEILIDLTYGETKSKCGMAWEICGDTIVKNILDKTEKILVPIRTNNDIEFIYNGHGYRMKEVEINEQTERQIINFERKKIC